MLRQLLLLAHLLGVIAWIGGMFFAYFCLRPAAAKVLQPPLRLPLWSATFARFLPLAALAVAAIFGSGLAMLLQVGFANAPAGWHAMFTIGLIMIAVFGYVWLALFPQLRDHCAAADWPAAGADLLRIRQMVALNLLLGLATVVAAVSAR